MILSKSSIGRNLGSSASSISDKENITVGKVHPNKRTREWTKPVSQTDVRPTGRQKHGDSSSVRVERGLPLCLLNDNVELPKPEEENLTLAEIDVEALLAEKMTGKNKFDYKGKSEQMFDYIKRLRVCVKSFQQREASLLSETAEREERLNVQISNAKKELEVLKSCTEEKDGLLKAMEKSMHELVTLKASTEEALKVIKEDYLTVNAKLMDAEKGLASESETVKELLSEREELRAYGNELQGYNKALQSHVTEVKAEKTEYMQSLKDLRSQLEETVLEKDRFRGETERLAREIAFYTDINGKTAQEAEKIKSKATDLEEINGAQQESLQLLRQQLESSRHRVAILECQVEAKDTELAKYNISISDLKEQLSIEKKHILEGEAMRRSLHNTILELKGNIRVFCRVRPLQKDEQGAYDDGLSVVQFPTEPDVDGRAVELVQPTGSKYTFEYDRVFGPNASQQDVFEEIEQLVQSALDGYRVCIFAYGQTGSGKTHTMLGTLGDEDQQGMIPRSLEKIFESKRTSEDKGWIFYMQASMLEIYNETIRDLLCPSSSRSSNIGVASSSESKTHNVKHDSFGNTTVTDLTLVDVNTTEDVSMLLSKAAKYRAVGKTAINERSSRSHCVFTLRITGKNESTDQQVNGVLNLIDLAGSERLKQSEAAGDRLKETQNINKSLSALSNVILAMANKESHVPFRDSKLTYLLQPSLGGDAKTLMFVNVAPTKHSLNESVCSLRFASKVNACQIGIPKRQAVQPCKK